MKLKKSQIIKLYAKHKGLFEIANAYSVRMVSGLVISKIIAIYTGPNGVAIIGQFQNFINLIKPLSTLGTNIGVINLIAKNSDDSIRVKNNAITLSIIISTIISIILWIFSNSINEALFLQEDYNWLIKLTAAFLICFSVNEYFYSFYNGHGDIKSFSLVNMLQSIDFLALSLICIYLFSLNGALIAIVAGQFIQLIVNYLVIKKKGIYDIALFRITFDEKIVKSMFSFLLITLANAVSVAATMIFIRSRIIDKIGIESAGHWQAVWRISEVYLGFITMFLKVSLFPKLSKNLENSVQYEKEMLSVIKVVIPVSILIIGFTYISRDYIVKILFSSEFEPATKLFKYQLVGDFLRIISWTFAYHLLANTMTFIVVSSTIVSNLFFVLLSIYFIDYYSTEGVTIAYAINYFFYLIFVIWMYVYRNKN